MEPGFRVNNPEDQKPLEFALDTEFAAGNPLMPISVALVGINCDVEWYAEFPGARKHARSNDWLRANVDPGLTGIEKSSTLMLAELTEVFSVSPGEAVIYADWGAYDFFLLSECVCGGFSGHPPNMPHYFREVGHLRLPLVEQIGLLHNALDDARTLRAAILKARMEGMFAE